MTRPLLSIGMIVKNEERCLEKCLKALKPLRDAIPCELVIADTGSTDKTREIAEKYADVVFDFEWVNDFAAARNAVIDKSTGEWFLSVDADEYLASAVTEIVDFIKNPTKKYLFASTVIRSYGNVEMTGLYSDFNAVRMVLKDSGVRYAGAIHESFCVLDKSTIKVLPATIFEHDGYVPLSLKQVKQKEKRNLDLLEKELEKNPNDIRRILQCIESSRRNVKKNLEFANRAIEILMNTPKNSELFISFGASCAKEVVKSLLSIHDSKVDMFVEWTIEHFPNSYHTTIDINHLLAKEYYQKEDYKNCVKFCEAYLTGLEDYRKKENLSYDDIFISDPDFVHKYYEFETITILSNALIELDEIEKATNYLEKIDLSDIDIISLRNWFNAIYNVKDVQIIAKSVAKVIDSLFETYKEHGNDIENLYNLAFSLIMDAFSCRASNDKDYNVFSEVSGTIGVSVKIANAKSKEEAEELLAEIKKWDDLMPLALNRCIELGADLPNGFYFMNSGRLSLLLNDLMYNVKNAAESLLNNYFNVTEQVELYKINFSFNFISTILLHKNFVFFTNDDKMSFVMMFCKAAEIYLNSCYNEEFLKDEEKINCIPQLHQLGLYFSKAIKLKKGNALEYVKALRFIIKKLPQSKQVVEFLIEDLKSEEELKKQEKIKNTSPELLAMAEQLKMMFAAFPPNSPELIAIKQTPMYKQLAFLIED